MTWWYHEPCSNGHTFIWTSNNTNDGPPDDLVCECGCTTYKKDGE